MRPIFSRQSPLRAGLILAALLVTAACGGQAEPPATLVAAATAVPATVAAAATTAPTDDPNQLATDVAAIANPPTATPNPAGTSTPDAAAQTLPGPLTSLTRKFHFASLNLTLESWQLIAKTTSTGETCDTSHELRVAVHLNIQNLADQDYNLDNSLVQLVDAQGKEANLLSSGRVSWAPSGFQEDLTVPAGSTQEAMLCSDLDAGVDPAGLFLVFGDADHTQVKVPLAAAGPADLGGYVAAPLGKSAQFKGATIDLPQIIVTTGVWGDGGDGGQSKPGKKWVMLTTKVNNPTNPNLFIEATEITLEVDGQPLEQSFWTSKSFEAAPYGLAKGQTGTGALLYEVPDTAQQATLHLKSGVTDFTDDVKLDLTLPALP